MNVTFVESQTDLVEDNIAEISYVLSVKPAVRQPQLYDLCGSTLGLVFDLSIPSTSAVVSPLLDLAATSNSPECPSMKAVNSSSSTCRPPPTSRAASLPGRNVVSGAKNCEPKALCPQEVRDQSGHWPWVSVSLRGARNLRHTSSSALCSLQGRLDGPNCTV